MSYIDALDESSQHGLLTRALTSVDFRVWSRHELWRPWRDRIVFHPFQEIRERK